MVTWDDKARQAYSHTYFLQKNKWGYQLDESEAIELGLLTISHSSKPVQPTRTRRTRDTVKKEPKQ